MSHIFHSGRMTLSTDVDLEEHIMSKVSNSSSYSAF